MSDSKGGGVGVGKQEIQWTNLLCLQHTCRDMSLKRQCWSQLRCFNDL